MPINKFEKKIEHDWKPYLAKNVFKNPGLRVGGQILFTLTYTPDKRVSLDVKCLLNQNKPLTNVLDTYFKFSNKNLASMHPRQMLLLPVSIQLTGVQF